MMFLQKPMLGTQIDWSNPLNDGVVLDLLMNEGHGNIVHDLSGWGNNGTLHGFDFPSTVASGWNPGMDGVALNFDGVDDYINCGNNPSFNITDEITIDVWVNSATDEGYNRVIVGKVGAWQFQVSDTDPVVYFVFENVGEVGLHGGTALKNNLYHFTTTYKPGEWKFFINGIEINSRNDITDKLCTNSNTAFIGRRTDTQLFYGTIARSRILTRAMSAFEVMQTQIDPYGVYLQ